MGIGENSVSAPDMVIYGLGFLLQQGTPSVFFVLDNLIKHFFEPLDDGAFRLTECHLVGHLEDISKGLSAFAVETAHRQAEFIHRLDDRVDLLRQHKARQM